MAFTAVSSDACAVIIRIWLSVFSLRISLMTSMPVLSVRLKSIRMTWKKSETTIFMAAAPLSASETL